MNFILKFGTLSLTQSINHILKFFGDVGICLVKISVRGLQRVFIQRVRFVANDITSAWRSIDTHFTAD